MADEHKYQASFRGSTGALLNIRGDELEEFVVDIVAAKEKDALKGFFDGTAPAYSGGGNGGSSSTGGEPATDKQKALLKKLGVGDSVTAGLTKAEASAQIEAKTGK